MRIENLYCSATVAEVFSPCALASVIKYLCICLHVCAIVQLGLKFYGIKLFRQGLINVNKHQKIHKLIFAFMIEREFLIIGMHNRRYELQVKCEATNLSQIA